MKNLLVAQSGGPSAAINATITGVIDAGIESGRVGHVYGALNGIKGVLNENFVNLDEVCDTKEKRDLLAITPAAALGSCRWKLGNPKENVEEFEELDSLKRTLVEKERQLVHIWAQSVPEEEKTVCMFSEDISADAMRQYVNEVLEKERILCAVFYGNDAAGYRYVIGSRTQDLRVFSKMLNAAFEGRGGGKPEMVQGTVKGEAGKIREWIQKIAEELSYEK